MENKSSQFQPVVMVLKHSLFVMVFGVPLLVYGSFTGVHLVVASKVLGPVVLLFIFVNLSFLSVYSAFKESIEKVEVIRLNVLLSVMTVLLSIWRVFDFYDEGLDVRIRLITQSIIVLLVGVLWTFSANISFQISSLPKIEFQKYRLPKLVFRILNGLTFLIGASVLIWSTFLVIYIPLFM